MYLDCKNTGERWAVVLDADVGGGEAELASKLLALHDPPVDDVGAAEQLGGAFELARSQRLAHRRAGNAFAEHGDAGHGFDRESLRAVLRPSRLQTCEVALPACAEAEIVADHEVFDAQAVDQYAGDEVFRGEPGQAGVEVADTGQRDAFLGNQFELLAQGRESRRRRVPGEKLARVRLESEYGGLQAAVRGMCDQAAEQGAMTEVHTVEIADGEHGRGGRHSL